MNKRGNLKFGIYYTVVWFILVLVLLATIILWFITNDKYVFLYAFGIYSTIALLVLIIEIVDIVISSIKSHKKDKAITMTK